MNINPYESPSLPEQQALPNTDRISASLDWRILLIVLMGLNPLICTIVIRRASLQMAVVAFIAILVVTIFAISDKKLGIPMFALLVCGQSLHWLGFCVPMLVIRTHIGYLTTIGEQLQLDEEWLWTLLGFSFAQCLIMPVLLRLKCISVSS